MSHIPVCLTCCMGWKRQVCGFCRKWFGFSCWLSMDTWCRHLILEKKCNEKQCIVVTECLRTPHLVSTPRGKIPSPPLTDEERDDTSRSAGCSVHVTWVKAKVKGRLVRAGGQLETLLAMTLNGSCSHEIPDRAVRNSRKHVLL